MLFFQYFITNSNIIQPCTFETCCWRKNVKMVTCKKDTFSNYAFCPYLTCLTVPLNNMSGKINICKVTQKLII